MSFTTAAEIARANGLDPKRYRQALRDAQLSWYVWGASWTVEIGSPQHEDMLRILRTITGSVGRTTISPFAARSGARSRIGSDETYIIDLCDEVLGQNALRQHCFDFLRGYTGQRGRGRMLPVDAWYPELMLVIEYRERQHSEEVDFFDRKPTVSGVDRGEQRKLYDQRRREVFPCNGIKLIEFDYFEFDHTPDRRLVRSKADRQIISERLERSVA